MLYIIIWQHSYQITGTPCTTRIYVTRFQTVRHLYRDGPKLLSFQIVIRDKLYFIFTPFDFENQRNRSHNFFQIMLQWPGNKISHIPRFTGSQLINLIFLICVKYFQILENGTYRVMNCSCFKGCSEFIPFLVFLFYRVFF